MANGEVPQALLSALRAGHVVVSVGAGFTRGPCEASCGAGFQGFEGFLRELAARCGVAEVPGCRVPEEGQGASYTDLDTVQFAIARAAGKERVCAEMRDMFRVDELPKAMERSLDALFKLPIASVMTWNWDEILERRCRLLQCGEAGYEDFLISRASSDRRPTLLKLQGRLDDPSHVVVAEDDYARVAAARNAFLRRAYGEKCVLHVGLGLRAGGLLKYECSGRGRHFAVLPDVTEGRRRALLAEQDVVPLHYNSAEGHVEGVCAVLSRIAVELSKSSPTRGLDTETEYAKFQEFKSEGPPAQKHRSGEACSGGAARIIRAIYVSGNEGKYAEAQHVVRLLCGEQVLLERASVDLPELQGTPEEIAKAKTREAATLLKDIDARFIITDDGGLELGCLNGFPGVYIKPMMHCLADTGLAALVHRHEDRSAVATCTLGIIDRDNPSQVCTFRGELRGSILAEPRGNATHGKVGYDTVFVPCGCSKSLGELALEEHATMSHRRKAFKAWLESFLPGLDA